LQQFESEGGVACADPAELGAACEVIITLVVNADQNVPEYAERLGHRLAERDILLIHGPLSGGAAKAADGAITMITSGPAEAYAKREDVLAAIASKVYRLGERHGQGSKVKIINQLLIHIAAAAEAMADCARALISTRFTRSYE
jgi:putative dehydrogenase